MPNEKTRIWRMTHFENVALILKNGLFCRNSAKEDKSYINIGFKTLIEKRGGKRISIGPGGVINDYVPFYFHFKMPMLYKIFNGEVPEYKGTQEDIIYVISSVEKIVELNLPFVFTDRHAYLNYKSVYTNLEDLPKLKWDIIKDDTWHLAYTESRKELKQAEFLIYQHVPVNAILGFIAFNALKANYVHELIKQAKLDLKVVIKPEFYY